MKTHKPLSFFPQASRRLVANHVVKSLGRYRPPGHQRPLARKLPRKRLDCETNHSVRIGRSTTAISCGTEAL